MIEDNGKQEKMIETEIMLQEKNYETLQESTTPFNYSQILNFETFHNLKLRI